MEQNRIQNNDFPVISIVDENIEFLCSKKQYLSNSELGFFAALNSWTDKPNIITKSYEEIAKMMNVSRQTVSKQINNLIQKGMLIRKKETDETGKLETRLYINPNIFFYGDDMEKVSLKIILMFAELESRIDVLKELPFRFHEEIEIVFYTE